MQCPHCQALLDEDEEGAKFCGECGGLLTSLDRATTSGAGVSPSSLPPVDASLRCPGCGAGPAAVDDDGFCSGCGMQRKRPARDHFEVVVGPTCAGVSDIGKKHHQNEDFIALTAGLSPTGEKAQVLVLCDGVSQSQNPELGSKAGAEAACATALAQLQGLSHAATDGIAIVHTAISAAQDAICAVTYHPGLKDNRDHDIDPAQSTIVMALIIDKKIHIGWAGDSRAYWCGKGSVVQLSRDDSWADEQVAAGLLSMDEAMKRPEAHAITNSLGALPDGANPGIRPNVLTLNVTEPGRLLLCSDGFWNYAEDPRSIAKLLEAPALSQKADALTVARALVNFARDTTSGGKDNISVIIRDF
jgi:PPM family protein phosphatase